MEFFYSASDFPAAHHGRGRKEQPGSRAAAAARTTAWCWGWRLDDRRTYPGVQRTGGIFTATFVTMVLGIAFLLLISLVVSAAVAAVWWLPGEQVGDHHLRSLEATTDGWTIEDVARCGNSPGTMRAYNRRPVHRTGIGMEQQCSLLHQRYRTDGADDIICEAMSRWSSSTEV